MPKNYEDHEYVKCKAENYADQRQRAPIRASQQDTLRKGWNCKYQSNNYEAAPEADSVNAEQSDNGSKRPKCEIFEPAVLRVWVEDQIRQKEQEQKVEFPFSNDVRSAPYVTLSFRKCLVIQKRLSFHRPSFACEMNLTNFRGAGLFAP